MDAKAATHRWYHPAPAWLVYGAVLATGVLFASERWRWFPVNEHKGYTVLLAVTVVGAVFALLPAWMLVGLVFRRRVQFGLRTLLVFVTLCAVVCSWLAVRLREAGRKAWAVRTLYYRLDAGVNYYRRYDDSGQLLSGTQPSPPEPLTSLLGDEFFGDCQSLNVVRAQAADRDLAVIAALMGLRELDLNCDKVTDGGLSHLEGLTHLRVLSLGNAKVTDEGVKKLQRALPKCKIIIWPPIKQ